MPDASISLSPSPSIAAELRKAWGYLGGNRDMFDSLIPFRPLLATFEHAGADAELLAILGGHVDSASDERVLIERNAGMPGGNSNERAPEGRGTSSPRARSSARSDPTITKQPC